MDPLSGATDEAADAPDDPDDERIGKLVDDRYTILAAIASGSMGVVYRAERIPVGKLVAIKFLHRSVAKEAEFLTRFERETRVMSKLSHPNCVSVVDFGVWEDAPYLVMELVTGQTLRDILDDEPIAPQRALLLTRQIAAGLAHAHAQGVVHRDIKPANIMITAEPGTGEHLRVLDFGLARLRGNVGRDATQANVVVGTPNYMAPEQTIGGGTIDARTDLYAVGVVLFEMITGERPFSADDTLQLLGMHRAAPVPRLADRIEHSIILPDGVQVIIDRLMAKAPAQRFQTAVELTEAIDAIIGPRISTEQKVVSPRRDRAPDAGITGDAAVASTLVDVGSAPTRRLLDAPRAVPRVTPLLVGGVLAAVLAGAAVWVVRRPVADEPGRALVTADAAAPGVLAAATPPLVPDAAMPDAAVPDAAMPDAAMPAAADEIEMDPMVADNPDPAGATSDAEDEAADAPSTTEDAERRMPATPVLAATVREAVMMLKAGRRDDAFASLRALWGKSPDSAYIPFLLGNIYNDRLWWSVAIDHYKVAIIKNGAYRGNAVLNRNVIRMLASPKTQRKATAFLSKTIGRSAVPYLRSAAKTEKNRNLRTRAAALAKQIR